MRVKVKSAYYSSIPGVTRCYCVDGEQLLVVGYDSSKLERHEDDNMLWPSFNAIVGRWNGSLIGNKDNADDVLDRPFYAQEWIRSANPKNVAN